MKSHTSIPSELGTKGVWQLVLQYAIPSVIAMTATSLYNITDSIFIGHGVGATAIAGLAITFPLMNLGAAFGAMVGVGATTIMSLRLGQKDYSSATIILGNVLVLNVIFGLLYTVGILVAMDPILTFFGASSESLPYAKEYMTIISLGNVITHMYFGLNSLLRAVGKPRISMLNTLITVILNAILTAIFIYVFSWGIKGAALATVIAQAIMLIRQLKIFSNPAESVRLQKHAFRLNHKVVSDSLAIGLSPFFMNATASAVVIVINKSLASHGGDLAIGAYGIVNRVALFFPMVVMGLNQGMQPIVGYNYGARLLHRVHKTFFYTLLLATAVLILGFVVGVFYPQQVARLFTTDAELIAAAAHGLKTAIIFFPLLGVQMVTTNFFQSIGSVKKAIFLSLTRQVIYLIPMLLVLPSLYSVDGVWYSLRYADLLSSITASIFLYVYFKKSKSV